MKTLSDKLMTLGGMIARTNGFGFKTVDAADGLEALSLMEVSRTSVASAFLKLVAHQDFVGHDAIIAKIREIADDLIFLIKLEANGSFQPSEPNRIILEVLAGRRKGIETAILDAIDAVDLNVVTSFVSPDEKEEDPLEIYTPYGTISIDWRHENSKEAHLYEQYYTVGYAPLSIYDRAIELGTEQYQTLDEAKAALKAHIQGKPSAKAA